MSFKVLGEEGMCSSLDGNPEDYPIAIKDSKEQQPPTGLFQPERGINPIATWLQYLGTTQIHVEDKESRGFDAVRPNGDNTVVKLAEDRELLVGPHLGCFRTG